MIPTTYKALCLDYIIRLSVVNGVGKGVIMISALPPGRYKIYYLRPEQPQIILKSASIKLENVGKG